jgi:hypothetical protein
MKTKKRDVIQAVKVKITADAVGVSTRQVNRVIQGENKNDEIINAFLIVDEAINSLANSTNLVKAAADLVPFDAPTE